MTTDVGQLLVSLQLSDSAFPSGFYTMSHGLEGFRQQDLVEADDIQGLLTDLLVASVGPGDATALARAHEAARQHDWDRVVSVDQALFASKLNAELRTSSVRSGRQVMGIAINTLGVDEIAPYADRVRARTTPGCQPVVSAVCYSAMGVETGRAVASDLFAFSTSVVGAALRLRLTDHLGAQRILRDIAPVLEAVTDEALERDVNDLGGFVPMADICSAHHERADGRLFTS